MTKSRESNDIESMFADEAAQSWMEEHLTELKRSASGQHFLYWSLVISFIVGLAAHVAGYVLRSSVPGEPLGILADLLYALGLSLWTGVVVVLLVQVIPEAKRRQIGRTVAAYEAFRREKLQTGGKRDLAVLGRPNAKQAEREPSQSDSKIAIERAGKSR